MIDYEKFWKELCDALPRPIQPGEKTVRMLVDETGLDFKSARNQLKQWEATGLVEYVGKRRDENGHPSDAWRPVDASRVVSTG